MGFRYSAASITPNNLIPEVPSPEHLVEHHLEVVAGGGVAVEIKGASIFQDAVKLHQADGHHHQISSNIVPANTIAHSLNQLGYLWRGIEDNIPKGILGGSIPVPDILKNPYLDFRLFAAGPMEDNVIVLFGTKGWVKID